MTKLSTVIAALSLVSLTACGTMNDGPRTSDNTYNNSNNNNNYTSSGNGVVESITVVDANNNQGIGVGAVAGGVIGGVLGNQVGKGDGNTAATIAGAAGGAYVGHQIEKSNRRNSAYRLTVRMNNGDRQTFIEETNSFKVGDYVRVENGKIYRR